jgi:signal transduction histidine kinase
MHVDRDIFKNALDAIVIADKDGVIQEVNPSTLELIKKRGQKIVGRKIEEFFNGDLTKKRGQVGLKNKETVLEYTRARILSNEKQLFFFRDITELRQEMLRREHFLGIAGHELKNPLAGIKALSHLVLSNPKIKDDAAISEQIKKIDLKADALHSLIRELLDITKIKQNALLLTIEPVSFKKILLEVIEDFKRINTTHKIDISIKKDARLKVDKERIEQVIINLLRNAAKYSPEADKIIVDVDLTKKYLTCKITDFGIGIPEDETEKVFNLYYRLPGREKSFAGLGVGLYIAREIIKAHKGFMKVRSRVGSGTDFIFYLPLKSNLKDGDYAYYDK